MTAVAVLQAATSVNARLLGLGEQIGRVEAGMLADLLAVEGDPTQNISALRNVRLVLKQGTIHLGPTADRH